MKFCDCDYCIHALDGKRAKIYCSAFPDGVPDTFDIYNASEFEECNNGVHYEPRSNGDWAPTWNPKRKPSNEKKRTCGPWMTEVLEPYLSEWRRYYHVSKGENGTHTISDDCPADRFKELLEYDAELFKKEGKHFFTNFETEQ